MPSKTETGKKFVKPPQPEGGSDPIFDDAPTAPVPVEAARPGEASVADRPEGVNDEQTETPADPAPETQPDAPDEGEQNEGDEQSSGEPAEVRLGQAVGLLHRMPLGSVLVYADAFAEKIETLQYAGPVQDLIPRMRASEGRCAPVYFTMDDDGEPDCLFAGDDALAAAKAAGIKTVSVVLIQPGDAGAIQAYLNQQASKAAVSTEDDELVWRAHNE